MTILRNLPANIVSKIGVKVQLATNEEWRQNLGNSLLCTKTLNRFMNHHSKILTFPMNQEGTTETLLLPVKHHDSSKEKLCLRLAVGTSY